MLHGAFAPYMLYDKTHLTAIQIIQAFALQFLQRCGAGEFDPCPALRKTLPVESELGDAAEWRSESCGLIWGARDHEHRVLAHILL